MPSVSNAQRTILQTQHTLQGNDLTAICNLAGVEGADIDSLLTSIVCWDFDQLLGFTLHLFITAESAEVRTQVAQLLPKFGSKIVRPLIKIAHHFCEQTPQSGSLQGRSDISALAQQSTQQINPQALSVGFIEVLTSNNAEGLLPSVVNCLTSLRVEHYETVLAGLAQQLTSQTYQMLERQILNACSHAPLQERCEPIEMPSTTNTLGTLSSAQTQKEAHLVG